MAPLDATKTVLELGCGNGRWISALGPRVRHYVAVDFSPAMINIARRRTAAAGLRNVEFHEAAVQDFQTDERFDLIYLSGVSQYLHDPDFEVALTRLLALLRPGGVVIDRSTVHLREREVRHGEGYFSIYRTSAEIEELFREAGYQRRVCRPSYRFLYFPRPLRVLLRKRRVAQLLKRIAPLSFPVLETAAAASAMLFRPTGEALDYSHEFALFAPAGERVRA
jgi:SAM-dependent methyltransferase